MVADRARRPLLGVRAGDLDVGGPDTRDLGESRTPGPEHRRVDQLLDLREVRVLGRDHRLDELGPCQAPSDTRSVGRGRFPGTGRPVQRRLLQVPLVPRDRLQTDISTGYGVPIGYEEWTRLGSPTPQVVDHVPHESVWRYRGSNNIFLDSTITGRNTLLTLDEWIALGKPAPRIVD